MLAAAFLFPAGALACPAESAVYRLAGDRSVTARLGSLPRRLPDLASDLYLRIDITAADTLWFAIDRGSGHGDPVVHSTRRRLDRSVPTRGWEVPVVPPAAAIFVDAERRVAQAVPRRGHAAPRALLLAGVDEPQGPGTYAFPRAWPRRLGSAWFMFDRCLVPEKGMGSSEAPRLPAPGSQRCPLDRAQYQLAGSPWVTARLRRDAKGGTTLSIQNAWLERRYHFGLAADADRLGFGLRLIGADEPGGARTPLRREDFALGRVYFFTAMTQAELAEGSPASFYPFRLFGALYHAGARAAQRARDHLDPGLFLFAGCAAE